MLWNDKRDSEINSEWQVRHPELVSEPLELPAS